MSNDKKFSKEEVQTEVYEALLAQDNAGHAALDGDTKLEDLQLDSLDAVELDMAFEEAFGISLDGEDGNTSRLPWDKLKTARELADAVFAQLQEQGKA